MAKGGLPPTSPETVQAIMNDYYEKRMGASTIAKNYDVDKRTVYNILVKFGKGTRPRSNRTGETYHKPAGILAGVTPSGRPTGGQRGVRLAVNEKAFDELTPLSAYWIGFLMADGCVSREHEGKSLRLMLRLSVKDRAHLERFRDWIGSEHAIYEKDHIDPAGKTQRTCCLQICSEPLCKGLEQWGVVQRKTGCEKPAEILLDNRDFWRGCVDGDGCVYPGAQHVYLSGGLPIVEQWKAWAKRTYDAPVRLRHHVSFVGKVGCWVGECTGAEAGLLLRDLYRPGDVWLPRKAAHVLEKNKNFIFPAPKKKPWG